MRYDTPIELIQIQRGDYDPKTGNYSDSMTVTGVVYGSVMNAGADLQAFVYNQIRKGSLVIQLQNHLPTLPDRIRVTGRLYSVDFVRSLRTKEALVVSEVSA